MPNIRIDIIKDELNHRSDEILSFKVEEEEWYFYEKQEEEFLNRICEYIYFVRTTPELNFHFNELLTYTRHILESEKVKKERRNTKKHITNLGKSIKSHPIYIERKDRDFLNEKSIPYISESSREMISTNELIEKLANSIEIDYDPRVTINYVLGVLFGYDDPITGHLYQIDKKLYNDVNKYLKKLKEINKKLYVLLEFLPRYDGYKEASELNNIYRIKYPLIDIESYDIGIIQDKYKNLKKEDYLRIKRATRRINRILLRKILTEQHRADIIRRLKVYMEWFYRIKDTRKMSENELANEVAKFIFPQAYFPFIRFKAGRKEPDIYIVSQGEELLIELKKYDKKPSKKDLKNDINQALDYHSIIQSLDRHIDNQVYLVIFHYGDYFPVIRGHNPLLKNDIFVHISFIYLGAKNPSDRRKEVVYEFD